MTKEQLRAWAVHLFTMSGAAFGFLALVAITNSDAKQAVWWLILALIVDGVDGTLARRFAVTEHLPNIDGATIDNIVDYMTYVVIPAYYIWWFEIAPPGWGVPAAVLILISSQMHFADLRHKTSDNYFRGFPALWNIVVFFFFIFEPSPAWAMAIIVALSAATLLPLKFVHPFRVERLKRVNLSVAGLATFALIAAVAAAPRPLLAAQAVLVASVLYFLVIGVRRSLGPPEAD